MPESMAEFEASQRESVEEHTLVDNKAVEDEVRDYAFTFGYNHIWPLTGKSLAKNYVKFRGTLDGTRDEMNRRFGNGWSMQYVFDAKFEGQVERFELAELRLNYVETSYL